MATGTGLAIRTRRALGWAVRALRAMVRRIGGNRLHRTLHTLFSPFRNDQAYLAAACRDDTLPQEVLDAAQQSAFASFCRKYHPKPVGVSELAVLFTCWSCRHGPATTSRTGLQLLEAMRRDNRLADGLPRLVASLLKSGDLDEIDGLMVLAAIEGDGVDTTWVRRAVRAARTAEAAQLPLMRKLFALSRKPIIGRFRKQGLLFFENTRGLQRVNGAAKKAAVRLLSDPVPPIAHRTGGRRRFVFVASRPFPSEANSHLNMLLNVARTIRAGHPDADLYLAITCEDSLSTPWGEIAKVNPTGIALHREKWAAVNTAEHCVYPPETLLGAGGMAAVVDGFVPWVEELAPDLALFIGGTYESHICRIDCFRRLPVMVFATSVNHNPDAWSDALVATREAYAEKLTSRVAPERIVRLPTPARAFQNEDPYDGPPARRKASDFVIVTVLGNRRLAGLFEALDDAAIDQLCRVFDRCPDLVWLLVGEDRFDRILERSPALRTLHEQQRLKALEYVRQLRGLYRTVDAIFVMPGMTGGNQGVIAGLQEGLPAIASRRSDSSSILPPSSLYEDTDAAAALIEKLITDPAFRTTLTQQCGEKLAAHSVENVCHAWSRGVEHAIARGRARLTAAQHGSHGADDVLDIGI